ncbi:hypothetical protein TIFTF001_035225 [Ficus carica]|uniref:Uncharacterized protein n=1 Tax=Ficus carica TaxID=3494 RepID=A0AA88E565_FICCA|nr:hypothetical protein TIFTF001_035225 [Ficus carica]
MPRPVQATAMQAHHCGLDLKLTFLEKSLSQEQIASVSIRQLLVATAIAGRGDRKVASVSFEDITVSFATTRFAVLKLRRWAAALLRASAVTISLEIRSCTLEIVKRRVTDEIVRVRSSVYSGDHDRASEAAVAAVISSKIRETRVNYRSQSEKFAFIKAKSAITNLDKIKGLLSTPVKSSKELKRRRPKWLDLQITQHNEFQTFSKRDIFGQPWPTSGIHIQLEPPLEA